MKTMENLTVILDLSAMLEEEFGQYIHKSNMSKSEGSGLWFTN